MRDLAGRKQKKPPRGFLSRLPAAHCSGRPGSVLPAGNRNNNGTFNNVGSNANFWTATENDAANVWNRNLNSGNDDVNRNNNNKDNGFSVRCLKDRWEAGGPRAAQASLLEDLFRAYYDARRHKRGTINQLRFERNYEGELLRLYGELISGRYSLKPGICFINEKPVKREIIAADFRDRVVHHLVYNWIAPVFERQFIHDAYSCRKGKGTHYGINRMRGFLRACTADYQRPCRVLKLDIEGYFMSMDRNILYGLVLKGLKNATDDEIGYPDLLDELLRKIIFNDSANNSVIKGRMEDWRGLPETKSLFSARPGCGLPIGNLTSQLFGNIYLNGLDHFIKRELKLKWYGRYVDDMVIMHPDGSRLKDAIGSIEGYLRDKLRLRLHPGKIRLRPESHGFAFLGAYILPGRVYIGRRAKANAYAAIREWNGLIRARKGRVSPDETESFLASMNSYLGMMKHWDTRRLRGRMLGILSGWWWNHAQARGQCGLLRRGVKVV